MNDMERSFQEWIIAEQAKPENQPAMDTSYHDCYVAGYLAGCEVIGRYRYHNIAREALGGKK